MLSAFQMVTIEYLVFSDDLTCATYRPARPI